MSRPILQAESVGFGYDGAGATVVDDWSPQFFAGEMTALTGPSGCGKSTRLYVLSLLLRPTSGRVLLDGEPVSDLSDAQRARIRAHRFGFVFQDAVLDSTRTVLDNVLEGALYRGQDPGLLEQRAKHLMERTGVEVPPRRRPGQVSGGQAQRLALCRALVGEPSIIFADEPTGNLDDASARTVLDILREEARRGACIILVTHSENIAAQADRRLRLPALDAPADPATGPPTSVALT